MLPKVFYLLYLSCFSLMFSACEFFSPSAEALGAWAGLDQSSQEEPTSEVYRRVVTLDQGMTDLMYSAGAGGYIVGVSTLEKHGMFPDSVAKILVSPPDVERIRQLEPDWIIGTRNANSEHTAEKLSKLGFNVRLFSFKNWHDVTRTIQELGTYFGTDYRAKNATDTLTAQWRSIRNLINIGRPSVLFLTGEKSLEGFGTDTHLNKMIEDAGGYSLTSKLDGGKQILKSDFIAHAPADFIILTPDVAESLRELIQKHPYFAQTRAFKRKKIYLIASELTLYPSPRYIEGAKEFAQIFFTDLFTPLQ
ncbi:MAG TPA: ABC transporter substrate-binding protein [Rhodothermales bacterium]|nr:ABC transporter substrate-binding protein [Rhodothermales bacterium]